MEIIPEEKRRPESSNLGGGLCLRQLPTPLPSVPWYCVWHQGSDTVIALRALDPHLLDRTCFFLQETFCPDTFVRSDCEGVMHIQHSTMKT